MFNLKEMKKKVYDKKNELHKLIQNHFGKHIYIDARINFDLNSNRVLGYSQYNSEDINAYCDISLNEKLLEEFGDVYIHEVFVHEYAHACVDLIYSGYTRPHGKEFKFICTDIFHSPDIIKRSTNTFQKSKNLRKKSS